MKETNLAENVEKTTEKKKKKVQKGNSEVPCYTKAELASWICKKYNVRSDLALVALREGGKEEYTMREAEKLLLSLKERKV